jgi:hypothetical protein
MIKAEILADSKSPQGDRITTLKVVFPRIVLAELNTHRMLSKNSASSRAIPFKKMVKSVSENPFIPLAWQKEHKGMQGTEYVDELEASMLAADWLVAMSYAVKYANKLTEGTTLSTGTKLSGTTKQLCNRLLEPFMYHTVILTGTEWENFFKLRCPQYYFEPSGKYYRSRKDFVEAFNSTFEVGKNVSEALTVESWSEVEWLKLNHSAAEIHISRLAECIWDAMNESTPKELQPGEWHIPMGGNFEVPKLIEMAHETITKNKPEYSPDVHEIQKAVSELELKISTARLARISYETLGDNPKIDYEADVRLHDDLLKMEHMSPFEHCARAMDDEEYKTYTYHRPSYSEDFEGYFTLGLCRNFRGFVQYRELVERDDIQINPV